MQAEIIAYAKLCEIQRQLMEEAYRRDSTGCHHTGGTRLVVSGAAFIKRINYPAEWSECAKCINISLAPGLTGEVPGSERRKSLPAG